MTAKAPRLALVPFVSPPLVAGPRAALKDLGYQIDTVLPPELVTSDFLQKPDFLAAVCDPACSHTAEFRTFLSRIKSRLILGILHCQRGVWAPHTLDHFTEFVTWPCQPWELEIRTKRLCPRYSRKLQRQHSVGPEEFVGLNLIGQSPAFVKVLDNVRRLASYNAPVLIQGATGTGKELLARAIHFLSPRRDHPFIPVNCGAIPDNLFENELYGHRRGAFTDAKETQAGLVELAHKGTLFLDEAEALTGRAQVALLRFLENREYRPLGAKHVRTADVRLIAATNTELRSLAAAGEFRSDLLFRLDVALVHMPSLQSRPEDIELLTTHFLTKYSAEYGLPSRPLAPDLQQWLENYEWPGNVRELENFIQRTLIFSDGPILQLPESDGTLAGLVSIHDDHGSNSVFGQELTTAKQQVVRRFEARYLQQLMARTGGNVTLAAQLAGKDRRSLGKMLKKHGIQRDTYLAQSHKARQE